ncbi:hypothetical protein BDA96_03G232200 [Sorghum bicolor]|uniref:Uncharacterized protein n=1 Tax=Sorghum bicolor TaxID=4558 RepID=A0A921UN82_SORBI|nr:hypothetical protein BDA96_03G232200 [Sorghum bicolor]
MMDLLFFVILDMDSVVLTKWQTYAWSGFGHSVWVIWKTRNAICFDGKIVKSPTEILCLIYSWLTYWPGLQKDVISS